MKKCAKKYTCVQMKFIQYIFKMAARIQCYTCGENGHYANDCSAYVDHSESSGDEYDLGCRRCGRMSHDVSQCYAKTDIQGNILVEKPANETGVYVLQLEHGKYYVGKTSGPIVNRIQAHFDGKGSAWTKMHPPIREIERITHVTGDDNAAEQAETLAQMKARGMHNVRGWRFTRPTLTKEDIDMINALDVESDDKCRYCRQKGHFISACPNRH